LKKKPNEKRKGTGRGGGCQEINDMKKKTGQSVRFHGLFTTGVTDETKEDGTYTMKKRRTSIETKKTKTD